MRWTTRTHWWWGLFLPGWWIIPASLLISIAGWWFGSLGGSFGFLGAVSCLSLLTILALQAWAIRQDWLSFSLSIGPDEKDLLDQRGRIVTAERRIGLGFVGSLTFRQSLAGRLLDYGSLSIAAMGGPYEWQNIGRFRALRRIVESHGQWLPEPDVPLWQRMIAMLHRYGTRLTQVTRPAGFYILDRSRFVMATVRRQWQRPSYQRFLQFVQEFVLRSGNWRIEECMRSSRDRLHFQDGIPRDEAELYIRLLRICRILVTDRTGHEWLHERIRTLIDVRRRVSASWFRAAVHAV